MTTNDNPKLHRIDATIVERRIPYDQMIDHMIENSYKNFHVKGFDYLCLKRSPHRTEKVYFFDGDVAHMPEVVNPHDHRYNFETQVLAGTMSDSSYRLLTELYRKKPTRGKVQAYHQHKWYTPLNGGDGAEYVRDVFLHEFRRIMMNQADRLRTNATNIHTIRIHSDQCVLKLVQYSDVLPLDMPTRLFMAEKQGPNLNGLYERMDADHCIKRYEQYCDLEMKLNGESYI